MTIRSGKLYRYPEAPILRRLTPMTTLSAFSVALTMAFLIAAEVLA